MKKTLTVALYLTVILFSGIGLALDTTSIKYFPLKTGNVWVYTRQDNNIKYRAEVKRDSVFNNHKYYFLSNAPYPGSGWFRIDSVTGSLMKYDALNQCSQYYLNERIVDSISTRVVGPAANNCNAGIFLGDTNNTIVFGVNRKSKYLGMPGYHTAFFYRYVRDIGISYYIYWFYQPYGNWTYNLTGAVVNGVLYGDTTAATGIVGLEPVNNRIPSEFSLSQNYPNPFNPVTNVGFSIPKNTFVKLVIYDVLGSEIISLVNEELKAGTYRTEWNASAYPSGVYLYKITAGDYTETKKMILIK